MREIKFRAWDKLDKKMREVSTINWFDELVTLDEQPNGDYFKRNWTLCELMQYTGLKDKNGKEIYEGDIVTYYCGTDKQTNPMVVAIPDIYISNNDSDGYMATHSYEIIGNIYENPDLIVNK